MDKPLLVVFLTFILYTKCSPNKQFRIAGGNEARKDQFPFFAQIEISQPIEGSDKTTSERACGGTLIHPKSILTSALCFSYLKDKLPRLVRNGYIRVYMGSNIRYDSQAYINTVEEVYFHPQFDEILNPAGDLVNSQNDVAVCTLKTPYETNNYVKTIYLPPPSKTARPLSHYCKQGFIIGIGKTIDGQQDYSENLCFANVEAKTGAQLHIPLPEPLLDTLFYSESHWNKYHPLPGDYGGPYMCFMGQTPVQYGIMSRSLANQVNGTFVGVYEAVDKHLNFILSIAPNSDIYDGRKVEPLKKNQVSMAVASNVVKMRSSFYACLFLIVNKVI